jgi:hypothetical protein
MTFCQQVMCGATFLSALMACVRSEAQQRPNDDKGLPAWIEKRVQAWQPTADERRIDQIAWAKDLRTAQKLAKENARPVFLFSYSGSDERENAMALERC